MTSLTSLCFNKAIALTNKAMGFYSNVSLFVPDRMPNGVCSFPMGANHRDHPLYRIS